MCFGGKVLAGSIASKLSSNETFCANYAFLRLRVDCLIPIQIFSGNVAEGRRVLQGASIGRDEGPCWCARLAAAALGWLLIDLIPGTCPLARLFTTVKIGRFSNIVLAHPLHRKRFS